MRDTTDYRDGWLCIKSQDNMDSEPRLITQWYPVVEGHRFEFEHLLGLDAFNERDGWYSVKTGYGTYGYQRMRCFDGGATVPIAHEVTPIPVPKVRKGIETRYRNSSWQKLLKTGWVTA